VSIKLIVDLIDLYIVINDSPPWGLSIRQKWLRYSNSNSQSLFLWLHVYPLHSILLCSKSVTRLGFG